MSNPLEEGDDGASEVVDEALEGDDDWRSVGGSDPRYNDDNTPFKGSDY